MVALFLGSLNVPEIAGHSAAHAKNTGFFIEDIQKLIDILAFLIADKLYHRRVDITASGAHDQSLKRSQAHAGVHALAADGGGYAGSVAQMAHNDLRFLRVKTAELDGLSGHEHVAGAVETVPADAVFLIVLMRNGVQICLLRHLHAESGIPHRHIWLARHGLLAGLNAH